MYNWLFGMYSGVILLWVFRTDLLLWLCRSVICNKKHMDELLNIPRQILSLFQYRYSIWWPNTALLPQHVHRGQLYILTENLIKSTGSFHVFLWSWNYAFWLLFHISHYECTLSQYYIKFLIMNLSFPNIILRFFLSTYAFSLLFEMPEIDQNITLFTTEVVDVLKLNFEMLFLRTNQYTSSSLVRRHK